MKQQDGFAVSRYRERFRVAEVAADWLVRLETDGNSCHVAFAAWLKESPQNVHEFLSISAWSKRVSAMDAGEPAELDQILAGLRKPGLGSIKTVEIAPRERVIGERWRALRWAAVALLTLSAFLGALHKFERPAYATARGEQRSFKLPDGSLIFLNTRSRIDLHFSAHTREIKLLEGEALFIVARETARPFRVTTDAAVVQAVGTQFNVRRSGTSTVVSVMEGSVKVSDLISKTASSARLLKAGEQARVARDEPIVKSIPSDTAAVIAWRQRRLVFRDHTLADVAAEFNRYNETQIRVEGESVRNRHLTGAFDADNPQSLLLFFEGDDSLVIDRRADVVLIRSAERLNPFNTDVD